MHSANEARLETADVWFMQNSMTVCKLAIFLKSVKLYDEWEKSLSSDHLLRRWSLFRHHASSSAISGISWRRIWRTADHLLGNHHLVTSNLRFLPQGIPTTPSVSQCRISVLSYKVQVWSLPQIFVKLGSIFLLSRRLSFHPTKLHWNDSASGEMTLIGTVEKWTLISNVSAPQIVSRLAGSEAKACKNAGFRHNIALFKKTEVLKLPSAIYVNLS